jgi:tetratricopeptide (TPR) repeat protein
LESETGQPEADRDESQAGEERRLSRAKTLGLGLSFLLAFACLGVRPAQAQIPLPPSSAPPPPPPDDTPPAKGRDSAKPKPNKDSSAQSAADQPQWDPLRADKDMEVGKYYMHKGDVDAAIDRFQDATLAKPGYAAPYLFLGEAYEKKGKKKPAVKAYQRYLDLYPTAEDGDKIRKRIEKLHQEIDKDNK